MRMLSTERQVLVDQVVDRLTCTGDEFTHDQLISALKESGFEFTWEEMGRGQDLMIRRVIKSSLSRPFPQDLVPELPEELRPFFEGKKRFMGLKLGSDAPIVDRLAASIDQWKRHIVILEEQRKLDNAALRSDKQAVAWLEANNANSFADAVQLDLFNAA